MRNPLQSRGMLVSGGALGAPPAPVRPSQLSPQAAQTVATGVPGAWTTREFDAERFVQAGGRLTADILHPAATPFEQLYRRLPEEGMYSPSVTPSNPFTFELGSFIVPDRMSLLIFDLRPDIYRFSGVDPGDFLPIETRRFGSIMGFDLTVDQKRPGNTYFEIDPVQIQRTSQQAFISQNAVHPTFNAGQYAIGNANKFSNVAGVGTGLLPQRPTRYGALSVPFTIIARSGQTVQVRCVIFKPLPAPIAFVEYDMAGILVPEQWTNNMLESIKPPMRKGEEAIK